MEEIYSDRYFKNARENMCGRILRMLKKTNLLIDNLCFLYRISIVNIFTSLSYTYVSSKRDSVPIVAAITKSKLH